MWSLSPRTVVAHTRCNTYLQGKYSGQSFHQVQAVKLFTIQLCFLTADVADNHRRVGNCCERSRRCRKWLRIARDMHRTLEAKCAHCICQQSYQFLSGGIHNIFSDVHLGTWEEILWRWSATAVPCGLAWQEPKLLSVWKAAQEKAAMHWSSPVPYHWWPSDRQQQTEQVCPNASALFLQGHHSTNKKMFEIWTP